MPDTWGMDEATRPHRYAVEAVVDDAEEFVGHSEWALVDDIESAKTEARKCWLFLRPIERLPDRIEVRPYPGGDVVYVYDQWTAKDDQIRQDRKLLDSTWKSRNRPWDWWE